MDAQPTPDLRVASQAYDGHLAYGRVLCILFTPPRKQIDAKRAGDADPRLSYLKEEKKKYPPAALTLIDYHNISYLTQRITYDYPTRS